MKEFFQKIAAVFGSSQHDAPQKSDTSGFLDDEDIANMTEAIHATVIDQYCSAKLVGTKTVKSVREFGISFRYDDGNTRDFLVPEETYEGFAIGQTGTLTIVDGELYGFTLDEY